jgi:hypothetical protein
MLIRAPAREIEEMYHPSASNSEHDDFFDTMIRSPDRFDM